MGAKTALIWKSILSLTTAVDPVLILDDEDNLGLFLSRFIVTSDSDQEYGVPMIWRSVPKLSGHVILERNETS